MKYYNELCHVMAFYGIAEDSTRSRAAYDLMLDVIKRLGVLPRLVALPGRRKMVSYAYANRMIQQGKLLQVSCLSLYCLPKDAKNELEGLDVYFEIAIDGMLGWHPGNSIVVIRDAIAPLNHPIWNDLTRDLAFTVRPDYGVGFSQLFKFGPIFTAMGMRSTGSLSDLTNRDQALIEERDEIISNHEINLRNCCFRKTGNLSSVFPKNFLTALQLEKPIEGMTLREWIEKDPVKRGTLSPLTDQMIIWEPPMEEAPNLLKRLRAAGRAPDRYAEMRAFEQEAREAAKSMTREDEERAGKKVLGQVLNAMGVTDASEVDVYRSGGDSKSKKLKDREVSDLL